VPVVVECLTDNRNRTAPEIRHLFQGGSMGAPGCVAFFFNHLGVVEAIHPDAQRDAETDAIEAGAQEVEPLEAGEVPDGQKGARFLTATKDLDAVAKALKAAGWKVIASEMRYIAKNFTEISEAHRKQVTDFLNALDDHDDVHHVYAAMKPA
jgi:transcriptional/translational regulatory protein YebC/TACO1